MKGQLSAEMLILVTVVMAIVAIVAIQMIGTAQDTGVNINQSVTKLNERTTEALKGESGEYCLIGEDCLSGGCAEHRCE
jgi:cell division protein FtsL